MYYMSTYLMLLALAFQKMKLTVRRAALLATPALVAFVLVTAQVMHARGGIREGGYYLLSLGTARTVDYRLPGKKFFKKQRYVEEEHIRTYPKIVAERIGTNMGLDFSILAVMLLGAVALAGNQARRRYRWLVFAVPAGLSWNAIMIQHTVIHPFAGMFGYFLWMLAVGAFFNEISRNLKPEEAKWAISIILLPFAVFVLNQTYLPRMGSDAKNAIVGKVVEMPGESWNKAKPKATAKNERGEKRAAARKKKSRKADAKRGKRRKGKKRAGTPGE